MNTKHTPGRLIHATDLGQVGSIETPDGNIIAVAQAQPNDKDRSIRTANARRLAACWNACEGISTESLDRLGTIDRARVELDVIRSQAIAQRDELLEALQEAAVHIAARWGNSDPYAVRAFAVIAKATGEKA
jgi:hypothetical protein